MRLRDAALVAAQNEVIAAQDRYDSHDVTRVVRKLDILAQAESIRSSGMFILPRHDRRRGRPRTLQPLEEAPGHPEHQRNPRGGKRARLAPGHQRGNPHVLAGTCTACMGYVSAPAYAAEISPLVFSSQAIDRGRSRLSLNYHLK